MGCVGSTLKDAKHKLFASSSKREFQIPDIVIEEYIPRLSIDKLTNTDNEDYIWLTDTSQLPSDWFVHNCTNQEAEYMLRDKPDGTFLVRQSNRYEGQYVLAVSLHYFVHQLLIHKSDDGFGLMDPGVHPTLSSLVTHYSQVSLKTKNSLLDVKLTNGVFQTAE